MAHPNPAVIEPIAPTQQPDQSPQQQAPGVQPPAKQRKKSVVTEQSPDREELNALRAQVAQLVATQQRQAGPDTLTVEQLRDTYSLDSSYTDEIDPARLYSGARHIARVEMQDFMAQQRQEFARMSYVSAVSAVAGDPKRLYESPQFEAYARQNPQMDAAFRQAYANMDVAATVEIAKDFQEWQEEQQTMAQRNQQQQAPQPYGQPQYGQQYAQPYQPPQYQQQFPQQQWDHPPVHDVIYPPTPEQMMGMQQQQPHQPQYPQPNMQAQMMPRNAPAPPSNPQAPIYAAADVDAWKNAYAVLPEGQRTPEMRAQYTELNRAELEGRVR